MDYNKKKILYQDVLGNSDTVESYVINTPEDLEQVFSDNKIYFHLGAMAPMRRMIKEAPLILNEKGGYCHASTDEMTADYRGNHISIL